MRISMIILNSVNDIDHDFIVIIYILANTDGVLPPCICAHLTQPFVNMSGVASQFFVWVGQVKMISSLRCGEINGDLRSLVI